MITLKQLENALALQVHGNFRRAAEAQHFSQPAFSRSIQKLEATLGVTLFDRQKSGIKPMIYGDALLKRADTNLTLTGFVRSRSLLRSRIVISGGIGKSASFNQGFWSKI